MARRLAFQIFILFIAGPFAQAYNTHINGLKALQDRTRTSLTALDKELLAAYSETTKLTPNDSLSTTADLTLESAKQRIDKLLDTKHEEGLRLELVDKLIFKLSEKNFSDLKDALPKIIDEIVVGELTIGSRYTGEERFLIPFLMNLATALRTRQEPIENPLVFLENYLEYSSILNPKPVFEFRSEGGYINEPSGESLNKLRAKVEAESVPEKGPEKTLEKVTGKISENSQDESVVP